MEHCVWRRACLFRSEMFIKCLGKNLLVEKRVIIYYNTINGCYPVQEEGAEYETRRIYF